MSKKLIVKKGRYADSAQLMRLGRELGGVPGVREALVLMGTPGNVSLALDAGYGAVDATAVDMLVALSVDDEEAFRRAAELLETLLTAPPSSAAAAGGAKSPSLETALSEHSEINLVAVAVPGDYAGYVAFQALERGRSVFLFSNNVALEEEVALKARARELGLLVMGPDCGTAILSGVGLGFANRVRRGPIGIVGASGTGMQELACRLHAMGSGVSQAIGVGSRDLGEEVGGAMTEVGLELLSRDAETEVIAIVAKRPSPVVAKRLHDLASRLHKPVVVRNLGQDEPPSRDGVTYAATLDDAAAACLGRGRSCEDRLWGTDEEGLITVLRPLRGRLVGLYVGGSLAAEAKWALERAGVEATCPEDKLPDKGQTPGFSHLIVDTGEDFYTVGRPHPMVDQTVRCGLLRAAGRDPSVGLIALDVVLGDGAHPDPAAELKAAMDEVRAERGDSAPLFVASLTGTDLDPQGLSRQRQTLEAAGAVVLDSAARAAAFVAALLGGSHGA